MEGLLVKVEFYSNNRRFFKKNRKIFWSSGDENSYCSLFSAINNDKSGVSLIFYWNLKRFLLKKVLFFIDLGGSFIAIIKQAQTRHFIFFENKKLINLKI